jgi:hypothetical protein
VGAMDRLRLLHPVARQRSGRIHQRQCMPPMKLKGNCEQTMSAPPQRAQRERERTSACRSRPAKNSAFSQGEKVGRFSPALEFLHFPSRRLARRGANLVPMSLRGLATAVAFKYGVDRG